jgi:iron complex outermembrane receptor protein
VYSDKVFFTEWNNADAYQPAYTLLNFHMSYELANHTTFTAWVRNAGDKTVTANNIITAPLYLSSRVGTLMPPRTFGLTVGYSFCMMELAVEVTPPPAFLRRVNAPSCDAKRRESGL